jgi:hypothetical protein
MKPRPVVVSKRLPLAFSMIIGVAGTVLVTAPASAVPVFINELHYDNIGTDAGEAIEIAGPAGTDLSGWDLGLYNGSGGAPYSILNLSGVISNQQNGFGTLAFTFPSNGIQNGSPDGLALVNSSSAVQQFLSYEGIFTATSGPATGSSTDIGVSEGSSTPVGYSLQLVGAGNDSTDFVWANEAPATFGSINTLQSFTTSASTLLINELDYDQPGTDTAEFIELFNASDVPIKLSPYDVVLYNGATSSPYGNVNLGNVTLLPGTYFVICGDSSNVPNCDLDVTPNSNLIQNGDSAPDAIGLVLVGSPVSDNLIIDAVSYEGTADMYFEGSGVGLVDNPALAFAGLSRLPNGTDTDQNNVDFSFRCVSPGYANLAQSSNCSAPRSVPEPTSLALLGLGIAALGFAKRKKVK